MTSRAQSTESAGNSGPVLVVEDERGVADLVATVLESDGLAVVTAENGRAALDWLEAARANFPALVLLDIKMPVMDGREFARRFKERWGATAPIVVMTAYDDAERIASEIGAAGWLGKPFDIRALSDTVRRSLGRR